eukprot:COSAG04_NODE_7563_length_1106_cov_44.334657_2_plen_87_part_00
MGAQVLAVLDNPYIIQYCDSFIDDEQLNIVMVRHKEFPKPHHQKIARSRAGKRPRGPGLSGGGAYDTCQFLRSLELGSVNLVRRQL